MTGPTSPEDFLYDLARTLKKEAPDYFGTWVLPFLAAWIRDGGLCVYCGLDLVAPPEPERATDHVLPEGRYPALRRDLRNLVPACLDCNGLKRDLDPSEGHEVDLDDEDARKNLLAVARTEIAARRAARDAGAEAARARFRAAVAAYARFRDSR
jgi:hypothetical protein